MAVGREGYYSCEHTGIPPPSFPSFCSSILSRLPYLSTLTMSKFVQTLKMVAILDPHSSIIQSIAPAPNSNKVTKLI